MPTVAQSSELLTRRAWSDYAMSLEGLEGAEYDVAEQEAWDRLQETLHAIAGDESPLGPRSV